MAQQIAGVPQKPPMGKRVLAEVLYRDGSHLDNILEVPVSE